ncbi:MAG: N-acetylneuraminate synthase family protein, partial [Acidimicrobiales bacterium]|nr:N-acetylneuraminate synthase family protein [Acidimicrobiales bacterium]
MIIGELDTETRVVLVAEVGNNHEGSFSVAKEMVTEAGNTGADAVKFQTFRTEDFVSTADMERYDRLKSFELTID